MLLVLAAVPLRAQSPAVKKLAFLVGVEKYQKEGLGDLNYPDNDIEALDKTLKALGFERDVLLREQATLANVRSRFVKFLERTKCELGKDDIVFVALCGHGLQFDVERDKAMITEQFFCPYDAIKFDRQSLLPINEVIQGLSEQSSSAQNLLVIDACRDDPTRGRGVDGNTVRELPAKLSVLFACSSGQRSFESSKVEHGVFTYLLLEALRGRRANERGEVTWGGLVDYVTSEVPRQLPVLVPGLGAQQEPHQVSNSRRNPVLGSMAVVPEMLIAPFNETEAKSRQADWARHLREPVVERNSVGMSMVLIPPGEFRMGSSAADSDAQDDEKPQHRVQIAKPFRMSGHEVTVGQFRLFVNDTSYQTEAERDGEGGYGFNEATGKLEGRKPQYTWKNTGWRQTDDHPVVNVSWNDAVKYAAWLSMKEGKPYRLPSEAEWEYACRAGTTSKYQLGDDPELLAQVGNVADGTAKAKLTEYSTWTYIAARDGYIFTAPVGSFQSNRFGLSDMHGNVWEWCQDWYDAKYYERSAGTSAPNSQADQYRVNRGGTWFSGPVGCRSAFRSRFTPDERGYSLGFRLVRGPSSQ